jgi:hypothetical protein
MATEDRADKLRDVEKAREDLYFAKRDQELLTEASEEQQFKDELQAAGTMTCPRWVRAPERVEQRPRGPVHRAAGCGWTRASSRAWPGTEIGGSAGCFDRVTTSAERRRVCPGLKGGVGGQEMWVRVRSGSSRRDAVLDELRAMRPPRGAVGLVVRTHHHVRRHRGERAVVAPRPMVGAHRVVEALAGAVVHSFQ